MILEVFSNLNDSLLLLFLGIQLLMGFHVVCRDLGRKAVAVTALEKEKKPRELCRVTPSFSMEQIPDQFGYNSIPGMPHAEGDVTTIPSPQIGIVLPLNSPWLQSFI